MLQQNNTLKYIIEVLIAYNRNHRPCCILIVIILIYNRYCNNKTIIYFVARITRILVNIYINNDVMLYKKLSY